MKSPLLLRIKCSRQVHHTTKNSNKQEAFHALWLYQWFESIGQAENSGRMQKNVFIHYFYPLLGMPKYLRDVHVVYVDWGKENGGEYYRWVYWAKHIQIVCISSEQTLFLTTWKLVQRFTPHSNIICMQAGIPSIKMYRYNFQTNWIAGYWSYYVQIWIVR